MNKLPSKKTLISLALGSAFAAGTFATLPIASAGENPFAMQSLNKGYLVAQGYDDNKGYDNKGYDDKGYGDRKGEYGEKGDYGKRGEGRCGMSMADTDNDGRVSKDENARHCEKMFGMMDTDNDGYISRDEAKKMGYDRKHGEGRCGMSMADADNDGRVSKNEHARHCDMMFSKMDANNDGYIDKDEAKKMKRKRHGHGHGDRSGYGDRYGSGEYGDVNYRKFPHMKPMGE
jgi:Ca2+-binding EF-hand superfamily protein